MTLQTLLSHANVSKWDQATWFGDCTLIGSTLHVPDTALGASIARCFGDELKAVIPDLTWTTKPVPMTVRPPSVIKKSKVNEWLKLPQNQRLIE